MNAVPAPVESGADRLHTWWELSYAAYLVVPRTIMQSMPDEWQARMCALLDEGHEILQKHGMDWPPKGHSVTVQLRNDSTGQFVPDEIADYQRGRRRLWSNEDSTSSSPTQ